MKHRWIRFITVWIILVIGVVVLSKCLPNSPPYVVLIRALDENGQVKFSGSGCFIRPGLILTAGHIVKETERFEIVLPNGHIRPGYFEYIEDANLTDVGFIRAHGNYPIISFGKSVHLGQDVWIAGYALREMPLTLTKGIVSCTNRYILFFGKLSLLQVDAPAWPGHSGSPVLDKHNRIIGIHVGKHPGDECWSLNVPVDIIKLSLKKYDVTKALESRK